MWDDVRRWEAALTQAGTLQARYRHATGAHDHPLWSGCPPLPHLARMEQARAIYAGRTACTIGLCGAAQRR
jgi:hypothetical protein